MEVEEDISMARKSHPRKRGRPEDDYDGGINPSTDARRIKTIILANTKPSNCLKRGIGSLHQDCQSLRFEHGRRLWCLLQKLMRQHNYAEASGVMSVLLKGTTNEKALLKTRTKFMATLELIEHIKGDTISSRKIQNSYELWMKKLGPMKNWIMKLWYSTIPKELHLQELDSFDSAVQSETLEDRIFMSILNSEGHDAVEGQEANSPFHCDSNTSIRNDKQRDLGS